jgi:pimeloyl-ACP methyl ester carboxylesterase
MMITGRDMTDQDAQSIVHIPASGGTLAVLRKGQGPMTVWLHGWALDHRMWRPQLALATQWTMFAPDRRGFGQSDAPAGLFQEWQDVDALAPDGPFALIGFSQGAAVALDYARKRPDRVSALILIAAPLHGLEGLEPEPDTLQREELAQMARTGRVAEMKALWRGHRFMRVSPFAHSLRDRMVEAYDARDLLTGSRGKLSFSIQDLAGLPMPVLSMVGEEDSPWRQRCAALIAAGARHGTLSVAREAGHLCTLDDPVFVNETISAFLHAHHIDAVRSVGDD